MGPLLYRFIFVNRKAGQTPPAFIEQVVDAFLRAFGKLLDRSASMRW